MWILKSPAIRRGSTLRTIDSRYSANSTKNTALVTGWATEYGGLYTIIKFTRHEPEITFHSESLND